MAALCNGGWINVGGTVSEDPVSVAVLKSNGAGTEFRLSVNGVQTEDLIISDNTYQRLSIPGESATWQVGCPEVPKVVKLVAIPATGNVEMHVEAGGFTIINGINVPPVQEEDLWDVVGANDALVFDDACYHVDAFYPARLADISEPMIARDLRVVAVTMYPVQYNPVTHQLKVYSDLTVSVENTGGVGVNEKRVQHSRFSKAMMPYYRSEVINFDELGIDDPGVGYGTILIICFDHASVLTEVNYIADWKRKKGYNVLVATTTQTDTTSAAIKTYILNKYNDPTLDPPLEYVMIVGDATGSWKVAAASSTSDYGYSLLEGSDNIADVAIGRLSFENTIDQITIIRKKILKYETDPYMGGANSDWLQDGWMYAGISPHGYPSYPTTSTIHTMQYVRQLLLDNGYHNIEITTHDGHVNEGIIQSHLNAGVGIWNHRPAWISEIYCSDVDALNNGWMMPVCLNLSCDTGDWVSSTAISECLLRAGNAVQPQGAIAAIATATSGTHSSFNNALDGAFFYALITLGQYCVGDALAAGKAHFLWQYEGYSGGVATPSNFCYWNNLMGDPSLEVWTSTPAAMTATYPSSIAIGTNMVTVTVRDGASQLLEGAYIHAYKRNETSYGEVTGSTGQVILPIAATTVDTLFITVTKHDYKSVLGYCLVQTSPRNVAPVTVVIDDDNTGYSHGNANGEPNPGEGLEINVTLKNWGYQAVNGVSATIGSTDPHVASINNATVYYGNFSAGGQITPGNDFELTLSSTIPDGYRIELPLTIIDSALNTYQGVVVLDIKEANLEYVDHSWINSGDGVFDAGETVNLEVELENIGHLNTPLGIPGIVRVNHPLITVLDSTGTWPSVSQGLSAGNSGDRFQLYADTSLFSGTPFQVTLFLESAAGFRDTVIFNEVLGTTQVTNPLGPDAYGYYAFDNGDAYYSERPSYSWVEIDGGYAGPGTVIPISDYGESQDASALVTLPFGVQYYGQTYTEITVCSNGWFAFGNQTGNAYPQNWRIPGALGAMSQVSVLWDDFTLSSSGDGRVWRYYDSADHRFILEWSRVLNVGSGARESFEAIIFDENYYPTPTGDAEILTQYYTVTNNDQEDLYATVGIDNKDQTLGIEYTFNRLYPTPAATLINGRAILFTTEPGTFVDPPNIVVNPITISCQAAPGNTTGAQITIGNTGVSNLDYSIFISYLLSDIPSQTLPSSLVIRQDYIDYSPKSAFTVDVTDFSLMEPIQVDGSGGPDNFGHIWIDSDEPGGPAYSWVEISGIGTNTGITGDDQNVGPFSLGFVMDYYGNSYSSVRICSNGWLSFTSTSTSWTNTSIPYTYDPNNLVAPFWDDLYPPSGGQVFYYRDTASQRFIVQWNGIQHISSGGPYTFEAIIHADGAILFQYQTMTGLTTSATIGIENSTGTDGLQVVYNQTYVHNNLAIVFQLPGQWLEVSPLTGVVEPSGMDTLSLLMDASELEVGIYNANVTISNNDPNNSVVVVPVTFTVTDVPPAPPLPVENLVISKLGNHVTLTWSPVTENINGDPITVSGYHIYAGSSPSFAPTPENQIGTSTTTSFLDMNALSRSNSLFYVVTAVE